jgi:hypothetical protein
MSFSAAAQPGHLSDEARAAATATAFRLLGTYFANAPTWDLSHRQDLGDGPSEDADLLQAIRLRAALSAAHRLEPLLDEITQRLSFRYARLSEESVGAVRGRLDVERYIHARTRRDVPKRYPVHVLARRHETPENVLAVYAAAWVRHELITARAGLVIPRGAPELASLQQRSARLSRALRHPLLSDATRGAKELWLRGDVGRQLDEVEARLDGGHIAAPEPYANLVTWMRRFNIESGVAGDDFEWSFYDARFDTRLFEIWLLDRLAAAISRKLHLSAQQKPLWDRNSTPTYTWKLGTASIRLHFQWALSQLSEPVWHRASTEQPLDGIPDVTALVTAAFGGETAVIIDAKLRQRDGPPTDEIYKMLGYFQNRGAQQEDLGAIVYYAPKEIVLEILRNKTNGSVVQLGVDPSRGDRDNVAFDELARVIVTALEHLDPEAMQTGHLDDSEDAAYLIQAKAVSDLLTRAGQLPSGSLAPFYNILEQTLPNVWDSLDEDVRTILVSAEYFGATAPEGADLSGPLLGICAAVERLLCNEGRIFHRLQQQMPEELNAPITLGAAGLIKRARRPKTPRDHSVSEFLLSANDVDGQAILDLCGRLVGLNEHRRAAAHTQVILKDRWREGHAAVFGTGETDGAGILAHVVSALKRSSRN